MRWTDKKLALLQLLAPTGLGSAAIAERIGTSAKAVRDKASLWSIHIRPTSAFALPPPTPPDMLRARWATLIGPMREQLRSEIAATAEDVPGARPGTEIHPVHR